MISISRRTRLVILSLAFSLSLPASALAARPRPKPTPRPSAVPAVQITYVGSGSANFTETFSQPQDGCNLATGLKTTTSSEDTNQIQWNVQWKGVKPAANAQFDAKSAAFSAKVVRTDTDDCGGGLPSPCYSDLGLSQGFVPELNIDKSGKTGFILRLSAESQLRGSNLTGGTTCLLSSVFDNAITEGMNGVQVSEVRVKLTPAKKSQRKVLNFTIQKNFGCVDPAKQAAFTFTNCNITTNLSGTVTVQGKWNAKILP